MEPFFTIPSHSVGYGHLGLNGELGYEGGSISEPDGIKIISAHADSTVDFDTKELCGIRGIYSPDTKQDQRRSQFFIDNHLVMENVGYRLEPGLHHLEIKAPNGNSCQHTLWSVWNNPETIPTKDVVKKQVKMVGKTGNRILVCTVMSHSGRLGYFDQLRQSCEKFDVDLFVSGTKHKFQDYFWNKVTILQRDLRRLRSEYDTVLYIDGYDGFLSKSPINADEIFTGLGSGIFASAEVPCAPWGIRHKDLVPESPTKQRYICAGAWMGEMKLMGELHDRLMDAQVDCMVEPVYTEQNASYNSRMDDQVCWNELAISKWDKLHLDYQCEVFYNLQPWVSADIEHGKGWIRNKLTGKQPCVVHGPGPGKGFVLPAFNACMS